MTNYNCKKLAQAICKILPELDVLEVRDLIATNGYQVTSSYLSDIRAEVVIDKNVTLLSITTTNRKWGRARLRFLIEFLKREHHDNEKRR